jgi:hypothetical protein
MKFTVRKVSLDAESIDINNNNRHVDIRETHAVNGPLTAHSFAECTTTEPDDALTEVVCAVPTSPPPPPSSSPSPPPQEPHSAEPPPPQYEVSHLHPTVVSQNHHTGDGKQDIKGTFVSSLAKRGRLLYAARQMRRLVEKDGECNVKLIGINQRKRKYLADMFTTLVEMRWRYQLVLFVSLFIFTWFVFGAIYYVAAVVNGDVSQANNASWVPCIDKCLRLSFGAYVFRRDAVHYRVRCARRQHDLRLCHVCRHATDYRRNAGDGDRHWSDLCQDLETEGSCQDDSLQPDGRHLSTRRSVPTHVPHRRHA